MSKSLHIIIILSFDNDNKKLNNENFSNYNETKELQAMSIIDKIWPLDKIDILVIIKIIIHLLLFYIAFHRSKFMSSFPLCIN